MRLRDESYHHRAQKAIRPPSESELGKVENEMQDLETARKRLNEKGLALSIVKEEKIVFETVSRGISGLLGAIERYKDELKGASVADKVAGKAVALLCVYAEVKAVYAAILSRKAKALLEENFICVEWDTLVPNVLDADKSTTCPFEELAAEIVDLEEAYTKLKALQDSLGRMQVKSDERGTRTVYIRGRGTGAHKGKKVVRVEGEKARDD
jgi:hypothetical protein